MPRRLGQQCRPDPVHCPLSGRRWQIRRASAAARPRADPRSPRRGRMVRSSSPSTARASPVPPRSRALLPRTRAIRWRSRPCARSGRRPHGVNLRRYRVNVTNIHINFALDRESHACDSARWTGQSPWSDSSRRPGRSKTVGRDPQVGHVLPGMPDLAHRLVGDPHRIVEPRAGPAPFARAPDILALEGVRQAVLDPGRWATCSSSCTERVLGLLLPALHPAEPDMAQVLDPFGNGTPSRRPHWHRDRG